MAMQTRGGVSKRGVRPFTNGKKTMDAGDRREVDRDAKKKARKNRKRK